MPTVYRIIGAHKQGLDSTLAGACVTDGRGDEGQLTPAFYIGLEVNGDIIPLPHPIESHRLEELGETWRSAQNKGILLRVQCRICRSCGEFVRIPVVSRCYSSGCLPSLALGTCLFLWLGMTGVENWFPAFLIGCASISAFYAVIQSVLSVVTRLRYQERSRQTVRRHSYPPQKGHVDP